MINATVSGVVGNEPTLRTVNGKGYQFYNVAHKVNKDTTMWVGVAIPEEWHVNEYLHKGSRMVAVGSLSVSVYEGHAYCTIWAQTVDNLTPKGTL